MADDPWIRLAHARREYTAALAARDAARPGTPEYRRAVHRCGTAWTSLQHWERLVARREAHGG